MRSEKVLLITSAAYLDIELASEFGKIPPCFLPIENRRLFEMQLRDARNQFTTVYLTLPSDYSIDPIDLSILAIAQVNVLNLDPKLGLQESIRQALDLICSDGPAPTEIHVLHGDTYFRRLEYARTDVFAVGPIVPEYEWATVEVLDDVIIDVADTAVEPLEHQVLTGYFAFSDVNLMRNAFNEAPDFVAALALYVKQCRVMAITDLEWYDMGHVHTYHEARKRMTTERSFNSLAFSGRTVTKTSELRSRMDAEAGWYECVPPNMRIFLPQFLGRNDETGGYSVEYLYLSPLSDLFVFGELPKLVWSSILNSCSVFMESARGYTAGGRPEVAADLFLAKTLSRLRMLENAGYEIDKPWVVNGRACPPLRDVARLASECIPSCKTQTMIHGDLCFSNILYDFRTKAIKVIDPRGEDGRGIPSVFGDARYDMAKLYHSVIGGYDLIISRRMRYVRIGENAIEFAPIFTDRHLRIQSQFLDAFELDAAARAEIHAITVLLFLSMLPLHVENPERLMALMANGIRLFLEIGEVG